MRFFRKSWLTIAAAVVLTGCSDCGKESGVDNQPSTSTATLGDNNPSTNATAAHPNSRLLDPAARVPMRVGVTPVDAGH
jgi:hypothetical protein